MVTVADIRAWRAGDVESCLAQLSNGSGKLGNIEGRMPAIASPEGWTGGAADAAHGAATTLQARIGALQSDTRTVHDAIAPVPGEVTAIQGALRDADALAHAWGFVIGANGEIVDVAPAFDPARAAQREQVRLQLVAAVKKILTAGDGLDDALSEFLGDYVDDIREKKYFVAGDLANTLVEKYAEKTKEIFGKQAEWLRGEAARAGEDYLHAPGGSQAAQDATARQFGLLDDAAEYESRAAGVGKTILSKTPIIGAAITAGGIAYDIHNGKPPGKSIISGVGGMGAAMAVGAMIPGVGWAAVGAVAAGVAVGVGLDYAYDKLPAGWKKGIESATRTVGHGIADGAEDVAHGAADVGKGIAHGASSAWHAVFG